MSPEEIQAHKETINEMTHEEMARLWRFAPVGHLYFQRGPLYDHFEKRFEELGGMTPAISKRIGWEKP